MKGITIFTTIPPDWIRHRLQNHKEQHNRRWKTKISMIFQLIHTNSFFVHQQASQQLFYKKARKGRKHWKTETFEVRKLLKQKNEVLALWVG